MPDQNDDNEVPQHPKTEIMDSGEFPKRLNTEKVRFSDRSPKDKMIYVLREWVLTLAIAFAVAFFFRTTIASPRHIPTGSMIPTIKIGEFIFVNMLSYD